MITLDLYATTTGELLASVPVAGAAVVNADRRLVGGLAVPWDIVGQPSVGRAVFRAGSITVPADMSWVKLLVEHDPLSSIGYLNDYADTSAGLLAALKVADGPAGDAALAAAAGKTRDALSVRVEVDDWSVLPSDVIEVKASRLREISLVAVPAYDSARASVLASLPTKESETIMGQLRHMLDLKASAPNDPAQAQNDGGRSGIPNADPANGGGGSQSAQNAPQNVTASLDPAAFAAALAPFLAASAAARPGEVPAGPPNGPASTTGRTGIPTVTAAAQAVVTWQNEGTGNPAVLMAALNDVVPANDAGGASNVSDAAPQWLGELWTARQSARPFVDALGTPKKLTGLKAKGWRWVTRPQMSDYAGNKAAIPSNAVSTEPAEANAHRTAGGWDVDRVFLDLGDSGFITSLFEAAAEDYAIKSNAWLGAQLLAAAIAADADGLTGLSSLVGALGAMGSAAGQIGARLTWLAVAPDVFSDFSNLTRDQVPWWMGNGDTISLGDGTGKVGQFSFWSDPSLASGQFLGGDARAATYYEQGSTPIRVQAVNIPNGGVDLGVFGYNAMITNDERALFHGTLV